MRHIKGHIVQLEVEVQRDGRQSGAASERAGGREPQAEADVSDLALDNRILRDVIEKKL